MDLLEIHWQDSVVRKVVELPDPDGAEHRLLIEINSPLDWQKEEYQILTIQFHDVYSYEVHEGACWAVPIILEAKEMTPPDEHGNRTIEIRTTAGYRTFQCTSLSVEKGEAVL